MATSPVDIDTSIAALTVSGLTLKALGAMQDAVDLRAGPLLMAAPAFMTDFEIRVDSFGSAAAKKTIFYTLNYRLYYLPIGAARGLYEVYPGLTTTIFAFWVAIANNDALTGTIDLTPLAPASDNWTVKDPADNDFFGCDLPLRVKDFFED